MSNDNTMHVCSQEHNIKMIFERLLKIDKTLYFGNGHPSMTTQLQVIEMKVGAILWFVRAVAAAFIVQCVVFCFVLVVKFGKW